MLLLHGLEHVAVFLILGTPTATTQCNDPDWPGSDTIAILLCLYAFL